MTPAELTRALRLIVITDATLVGSRDLEAVVAATLDGGARAIQLRDKTASARELHSQATRLLRLTRPIGALLFINDRLDVALASGADGVHLGPHDLTPIAARTIAPAPFLIGYSTDDPGVARTMAEAGVDYLGCGAVFGTTSKDVGGEAIGVEGLRAVTSAVDLPVVGIGGINPRNAPLVAQAGATGSAVISAVMAAPDPASAARELLAPFGGLD